MADLQWPFIGHKQFGQIATQLLDRGAWPTTVLLQGPANIGKRSIAFWLVQRSVCQSAVKPCGSCSACRAVTEQRHPSLTILDGELEAISIEAVRQLQHDVHIRHEETRWVLVLSADRLTESAANSLLKLLEDPPDHVCIICTTNRPGDIPATVRSRLATFFLRPATKDEVATADRPLLVAAEGRAGMFTLWKNDPSARLQQQSYAEEFCNGLVHGAWTRTTENIPERLEIEAHVLRQVLYRQLGIRRPAPWTINDDIFDQISQRLTFSQLVYALQRYDQHQQYLTTNVAPRNVYEDLHQSF